MLPRDGLAEDGDDRPWGPGPGPSQWRVLARGPAQDIKLGLDQADDLGGGDPELAGQAEEVLTMEPFSPRLKLIPTPSADLVW